MKYDSYILLFDVSNACFTPTLLSLTLKFDVGISNSSKIRLYSSDPVLLLVLLRIDNC